MFLNEFMYRVVRVLEDIHRYTRFRDCAKILPALIECISLSSEHTRTTLYSIWAILKLISFVNI